MRPVALRALTIWALAPILALPIRAGAVESFTLDPTHTFPSFEIRHQGISTMRGKFNRTRGKVVLDPEGKSNLIDVTVDAASVDTGLDDLNQKLRGGAFFNVGRYPDVRFVATQVTYRDGAPVSAEGQLTLLGRTNPVSLEIRDYACTLQFLTRRPMCGADVHTVIKRSDYGMSFGLPLIGDEVRLAIEVEGFKD
ncbi:MAG: YceI family protein [Pseudomonadota bacterium]